MVPYSCLCLLGVVLHTSLDWGIVCHKMVAHRGSCDINAAPFAIGGEGQGPGTSVLRSVLAGSTPPATSRLSRPSRPGGLQSIRSEA